MDAPRLPHHLNREVVRRGGVLWTEFWEAANGTSIGWNHLRRWLRNPSEEAIVDCQCAQLYGVSSKCVARHASWGLRTCSCDCCRACANNVRYGICLYCTQVDCLLKLFRRIIHRLLVVSPEGVFTADFWPFKNIGANYLPSLEPFIAKEVIVPSSRLLFSTVVACDLKWPDLDNIEACLGQFIAAVGGSSEDLLRIFAKELRVDQWLKSGCGAPILKPGIIFEPGLLSCEQDLLPDWKKVPYVTSPQLMSHRHASTVSRQVLVLQKKECVPAGRRTTEFLYQAYRTVGSDACSDGYSRCVQYGRFQYQF